MTRLAFDVDDWEGGTTGARRRSPRRRSRQRGVDLPERPPLGLPAAQGLARPAPDRPPVLRLLGRRHRPLPDRRPEAPGDALGPRAGARAQPAGRDLGQPADHLHPRHRRRDGPGQRGRPRQGQPQPVIRDLPPTSLGGAPPVTQPRIYFGERPERLDHHRRPSGRVRLPGRDQRRPTAAGTGPDDPLDAARRGSSSTDPLRLLFAAPLPRPQPAHQRPGHRRQPAPVPPQPRRPAAAHRAVPALRQGPLPGRRRRTAGRLHPGRLHDQRPLPERPVVRPGAPAGGGAASPAATFNYLRNSVKIVDGRLRPATMTFYVADPNDPLIRAWEGVFPTLFRPLSELPADLRPPAGPRGAVQRPDAHVRQLPRDRPADVLQERRPVDRAPGSAAAPSSLPHEAYYVCMRMPGEPEPEFLLLQPMVPATRPNMISWVAARNDGADYGAVRVYRFPRDTSIFGPVQIEARIDADPIISSQITLWNQSGSKVIRGNLIVIPVQDSIIYLEPIYLQSTGSAFPEFTGHRGQPDESSGATRWPRRSTCSSPPGSGPDAGSAVRRRGASPTAGSRAEPDARRRRPGRSPPRPAARAGPHRLCERSLRAGPGGAPERRLRDLRHRDRQGPGALRSSTRS